MEKIHTIKDFNKEQERKQDIKTIESDVKERLAFRKEHNLPNADLNQRKYTTYLTKLWESENAEDRLKLFEITFIDWKNEERSI